MTCSLATMPFHQGDVDWVFARAMLFPKRRHFASQIPECSRPPALAGTDRRTTGNKGTLGRSRDIHHHDRLHSTRMVTLPLQSVTAESGENSSQNSPGQRSQEKYRVLALEGCF
ncbi:hypothetical protein EV363DRAFT_1264933 [Boletus edulis]|nr:hypothetical protein EV363DRAFT_1264933 [Boletus edulis]